jgi:hypothetical protein
VIFYVEPLVSAMSSTKMPNNSGFYVLGHDLHLLLLQTDRLEHLLRNSLLGLTKDVGALMGAVASTNMAYNTEIYELGHVLHLWLMQTDQLEQLSPNSLLGSTDEVVSVEISFSRNEYPVLANPDIVPEIFIYQCISGRKRTVSLEVSVINGFIFVFLPWKDEIRILSQQMCCSIFDTDYSRRIILMIQLPISRALWYQTLHAVFRFQNRSIADDILLKSIFAIFDPVAFAAWKLSHIEAELILLVSSQKVYACTSRIASQQSMGLLEDLSSRATPRLRGGGRFAKKPQPSKPKADLDVPDFMANGKNVLTKAKQYQSIVHSAVVERYYHACRVCSFRGNRLRPSARGAWFSKCASNFAGSFHFQSEN